MNRIITIAAAAVSLSGATANAQTAEPRRTTTDTALAVRFGTTETQRVDADARAAGPAASRRLNLQLGGIALGAPARAAPAAGGFDVTANAGDSTASLSFVRIRSFPKDDRFVSLAVTLSTPLSEAGDTELASLSGFANSTTLEFKFSNVTTVGRQRVTKAAIDAFCGVGVEEPECRRKRPDYNDLFWATNSHAWIWGAAGKVGHEEFGYRDPATLVERSETQTPWSASAFLAYYPRKPNLLATLAYEHQEAWEAADTRTACPAGAAPVVCVTGPLGPPTKSKKDLFSLELRRKFADFALAPIATYDAKDDVWGVEVPVYLLLNSDGALSGGVKFGWRSDDDDFRFGVFISQPFQVLTR